MRTTQVIIVPDNKTADQVRDSQITAGVPPANIKIKAVKRAASHSVSDDTELTVTNKTSSPVWVVMVISEGE